MRHILPERGHFPQLFVVIVFFSSSAGGKVLNGAPTCIDWCGAHRVLLRWWWPRHGEQFGLLRGGAPLGDGDLPLDQGLLVLITAPDALERVSAACFLDRVPGPAKLDQHAYQLGKELVGTACATAENQDTRDIALRVLDAPGFEPRTEGDDIALANCPFHILAREHTELVCGMNLHLLSGLLDGLASTGLTAHLRPTPANYCVRLEPTAPQQTQPLNHVGKLLDAGRGGGDIGLWLGLSPDSSTYASST